jgi:hypothetical protein
MSSNFSRPPQQKTVAGVPRSVFRTRGYLRQRRGHHPGLEQLKTALEQNKKTAEFKIYPEAPHGFHADYRGSYRKDAAEAAWKQSQAWFKKYGVLS